MGTLGNGGVMFKALAIVLPSLVVASVASIAQADGDGPRANFFADAGWSYVETTCPVAVQASDEVNSELHELFAEATDSDQSIFTSMLETVGKNVASFQMSDLDKDGIALAIVGAYGVNAQLEYQNAVRDQERLAASMRSTPSARWAVSVRNSSFILHRRADASLSFMDCLWPTAAKISQPPVASGWGAQGDRLWRQIAITVYEANCEIAYLKLSRSFLDADFADVPPPDRAVFAQTLLEAHEPLATAEAVAERCEDFS